MKYASHKWMFVDNVLISVSTSGLIPPDVWDSFIGSVRKSKSTTGYLATTTGSIETTSLQRKEVFDLVKQQGIRVAVVTDEKMVRGIVTAASWVGVDVNAFSWEALHDAIRSLDAPPNLVERVAVAVAKLKSSV